jgi:hypothetical protein
MWRISAGGTSTALLTRVSKAGLSETSPASTDAVTLDVDAPFGQQPQSRHMPAQSPNGSSKEVEQRAESPTVADTIQATKRIAAKVAPRRVTSPLITLGLTDPSSSSDAGGSRTARLSLDMTEKRAGWPAQLLDFIGCAGRI